MSNKIFFRPTYFIKFVEENGSHFAISQYEIWKDQLCEELLWAEVTQTPNTEDSDSFYVIWQDDWQHPVPFETFSKAEAYIRENYLKHTPQILGFRS